MENNQSEQREALEILKSFNERLLGNMHTIVEELSGARKEDTDKFWEDVLNSINWEIGVMNGTLSLLNDGKERINKQHFNDKLIEFCGKIQGDKDSDKAEAIKLVIPVFESLGNAIDEVL